MSHTIAVIEDHEDILQLIVFHLQNQGYNVVAKTNGISGLQAIKEVKPDLCLLDIMLPDMTGLQLCEQIKMDSSLKGVPVIFLTAKGEESDIVKGLELGADDYITKPFSPKVLLARVSAVLRRVTGEAPKDENITLLGAISIHQGRHEVRVNNEAVSLTPSEFQILNLLASKPGWVFSRNQIVDAIHGQGYAVTDRSIDFQMVGLRKKLNSCGHMVETVRGVGYRFKDLK